MLITCITHADAHNDKALPFRSLTEQGWREVELAAGRFRDLIDEETPKIEVVVSSPKTRCVETALLFGKAISDRVAASEIQLDSGLKAGSIGGRELMDLANNIQGQHILVSAHADLVRALPSQDKIRAEAVREGWFATRPVLVLVNYDVGESWDSAQVLACEGLFDAEWLNLLL